MYLKIILLLLLLSSTASAQQRDAATLDRILAAVESQRNQALTQHALAEARIIELTGDMAKTQARIKELEEKLEKDK